MHVVLPLQCHARSARVWKVTLVLDTESLVSQKDRSILFETVDNDNSFVD